MKTIVLGIMQFIYWGAFYTLIGKINDEKILVAALAVTLSVSMVTAAVFLAKRR